MIRYLAGTFECAGFWGRAGDINASLSTPYFLLASWVVFLKSSASFTKRHKGIPKPAAMLSATFRDGLRSDRSMSDIIFGVKSAFSAHCSC
jgi:hypothetical protein